jgi:hypothetical protein
MDNLHFFLALTSIALIIWTYIAKQKFNNRVKRLELEVLAKRISNEIQSVKEELHNLSIDDLIKRMVERRNRDGNKKGPGGGV